MRASSRSGLQQQQPQQPAHPASAAPAANVAPGASAPVGVDAEDLWLFDTPPDLVCPITLQLFKEPVITAAGQVYERAAIETHLAVRGPTDPLTNAPLVSAQLIPVYTLKGRSFDFRETVAKACVDKAYSMRNCELSVRYLRRASELVQGVQGLKVPGLCAEVVDFLQTHPSNAYNTTALRIFADGLRQAGYVDQAMQVYLRLVEHGEDASQQAAALRQCLACMGASYDASPAPAASPRHAAPGGVDHAMLPFLAHFMESQQTFSAGQMLELLAEAKVPEHLIIQLCEHLLTRRAKLGLACYLPTPQQHQQQRGGGGLLPTSASAASLPAAPPGGGAAAGGTAAGGIEYHDLMLRYMQLCVRVVQRRVEGLEAAKPAPRGGAAAVGAQDDRGNHGDQGARGGRKAKKGHGGGGERGEGEGEGALEGEEGAAEGGEGGVPAPLARFGRFVARRRRGLVGGALVALALLDPKHVAVRVLQAGGVVALAVVGGRAR